MSRPREIRPDPGIGRDEPDDPWPTTSAERTLEVEIAPLNRRRPGPDRAIIVAALAVLLIGAAVVKPWEAPAAAEPASGSVAARPASPAPPSVAPLVIEPVELPDWSTLAVAMPERPAWGLRVLTDTASTTPGSAPDPAPGEPAEATRVELGDGGSLVEQWYPVLRDWPGRRPLWQMRAGTSGSVVVPATASPIRLLALTSPATEAPLDIRLWRVSIDGLDRLDVGRPVGDVGLGDWYLAPPSADGARLPAWPAGWYRVEVLAAGGVDRLTVRIDPGPATPAGWPQPGRLPASQSFDGPLAEPRDGGIVGDRAAPQPFITVGPDVHGLAVRLGEPLDAHGVWLAERAGEGLDPVPTVLTTRIPLATGFGLRFATGSREPTLEVTSLVGRRMRQLGATRTGGPEAGSGDPTWAVVDAPDGRPWAPGIYRVDATWLDAVGERLRASYHVDLRAGPLGPTPTLLAATRAWSHLAGGSGVVVGMAPSTLDPSGSAVDLAEQAPVASPTLAAGLDPSCLIGAGRSGTREPIGIVTPGASTVRDVVVTEVQAYARPRPVAVRAVLEPAPGLVVLGPEDPAGWASGRYAATVLTDDGPLTYGFCVD